MDTTENAPAVAPPPARRSRRLLWIGGGLLLVAVTLYFAVYVPYRRIVRRDEQLRDVVLALHNFHDNHGGFPHGYHIKPDPNKKAVKITDEMKTREETIKADGLDSNPPKTPEYLRFSWRVEILPFVGHKELHARFNFAEPWDSPHNLKLAQEMPSIYRSPGQAADSIHTGILGIADWNTALPNPQKPFDSVRSDRFYDEKSLAPTIAIVQVQNSGVVWTEPRDLSIEELVQLMEQGKVTTPLAAEVGETVWVGFISGARKGLPRTLPSKTWRAYCTRSGREQLYPADFQPK